MAFNREFSDSNQILNKQPMITLTKEKSGESEVIHTPSPPPVRTTRGFGNGWGNKSKNTWDPSSSLLKGAVPIDLNKNRLDPRRRSTMSNLYGTNAVLEPHVTARMRSSSACVLPNVEYDSRCTEQFGPNRRPIPPVWFHRGPKKHYYKNLRIVQKKSSSTNLIESLDLNSTQSFVKMKDSNFEEVKNTNNTTSYIYMSPPILRRIITDEEVEQESKRRAEYYKTGNSQKQSKGLSIFSTMRNLVLH